MSVFLGRSALGFGKLSGLAETTLLAFKINIFFCQEKKSCTLQFFNVYQTGVVTSRSLPRKMVKCCSIVSFTVLNLRLRGISRS